MSVYRHKILRDRQEAETPAGEPVPNCMPDSDTPGGHVRRWLPAVPVEQPPSHVEIASEWA